MSLVQYVKEASRSSKCCSQINTSIEHLDLRTSHPSFRNFIGCLLIEELCTRVPLYVHASLSSYDPQYLTDIIYIYIFISILDHLLVIGQMYPPQHKDQVEVYCQSFCLPEPHNMDCTATSTTASTEI